MVVSVGPYRFHSSSQRSSSRSASSRDSASPPHSTLRRLSPFQPASINMRHVAGVACMIDGRHAVIRWMSLAGSPTSARLASSTRAPTINGRYSSSPQMSKDSVVTERTVSRSLQPGVSRIAHRKLVSARCGTSTPFGCPVEPEVYRTYTGSFAPAERAGGSRGCSPISLRFSSRNSFAPCSASTVGRNALSVRIAARLASSAMNCRRLCGKAGSSGT